MVILLFAMKVSKYVWICYSKKFLMRRNEIVNRHTWKLILNNFSCIEIWILRSYSRKCGQICRNFIVFGLGISLFRNKRFVLNEMFQQNTSKFAIILCKTFYFGQLYFTDLWHRPGHLQDKIHELSYTSNIIANYEAFWWNISLSENLLLL